MITQTIGIRLVTAAAVLLLWAGCGSTEEAEEEATPPPPSPVWHPVEPPVSFQTRTDTVVSATPLTQSTPVVASRDPEIRFMVQVGAFKDAHNASRVQALTRQRCTIPVLNDFNTEIGLYQIRVGFFETREAAQAFRQQLVTDYPEDYRDAWVVQLTR